MKKQLTVLLLLTALIQRPAAAQDSTDTPVVLDTIVVTGEKIVAPTKQTGDTVYTGSEVTRKGIDAQGTKASVSVYEAVKVLPGLSVESADPYGLAAEQKNIRIRGVRGYLGAMTIAGVPNWGGCPMGPREYLYDTENFESIAVYKGAVPADLSTGVGARGGAIELRPLWPRQSFGFCVNQGIGPDSYSRTFMRLDSGVMPRTGTGISFSGSYTDAEKWKGPGDLGPRKNMNLMLRQEIPGGTEIKLWFNSNDLEQDLYRPLTYDEVKDLGTHYDQDYTRSLTGIKSRDIYYYRYNRGEYRNRDIFAVIPLSLSDNLLLTMKPYYFYEDTDILGGSLSRGGTVLKRTRDIERYGVIARIDVSLPRLTASAGYWFESSDLVIRTETYDPRTCAFTGYGMYMHNDENGLVHSPHIKLAGSAGRLDWQAGLKFFYYKDPASQGYTSQSPGRPLSSSSDLSVKEREYDELLPTLGIAWHFSDRVELHASYGRNQIRPYAYMPLINLYNQNRRTFRAAGISLNDLFSGYDMETADNFELGVRLWWDRAQVSASVYYVKHRDLLTTVYDPRVGLSYYQNVGDAAGHGIEIETNFFISDHFTLFFNPTYTRLTYDDDLAYQGMTMNTKGKQVVDTPAWTLKTGLIFRYHNFECCSMLRYMNRRYGDAEHRERIDNFVVAEVQMGFTFKNLSFTDELQLTLECNNLFDEEYVSLINSMDDTRAGNTSYHVGSPFTTMLNISFKW